MVSFNGSDVGQILDYSIIVVTRLHSFGVFQQCSKCKHGEYIVFPHLAALQAILHLHRTVISNSVRCYF